MSVWITRGISRYEADIVRSCSDMSSDKKTFDKVIAHFSASSEDVRRSAAFAAGGMAVGNSEQLLPVILQLIQSDDKKRYLALQSLKEVSIRGEV